MGKQKNDDFNRFLTAGGVTQGFSYAYDRFGNRGWPTLSPGFGEGWEKSARRASGAAYVSSKHGQIGLTTCASAELAPQGIRVNLICPGFIDTPMHRRGRAALGDKINDDVLASRVHARRTGRPQEIAQSVVFLCSDEASYITGSTLTPDGGFTLTI